MNTIEDYEFRMNYNPEKRLNEIKNLLTEFIKEINNSVSYVVHCENVDLSAEKILVIYNFIIHEQVKSLMLNEEHNISRSKIIVGTQLAVMYLLPIKVTNSNSVIEQIKINAILCWVIYLTFVFDFKSIKDPHCEYHFEHNTPEYYNWRNDYISWLLNIDRNKNSLIIASWFLDLLTPSLFSKNC
ncbi:MAG: hypothetical protein IPM92_11045 [Saprospiraceae bacterium]|nr:hypothetical protein [Saprospiraceae bacterium]